MRTIPIIIIFLFGFTKTKEPLVDYLFYDMPLEKDSKTIHNFIKSTPNFSVTDTDTSSGQLNSVTVRVNKINTFNKNADSAFIQLEPASTALCRTKPGKPAFASNGQNVTLTLYFKTQSHRNMEYDTINKLLNKKFKYMYDDGIGRGSIYRPFNKNYPALKLLKDTINNNTPYIKLVYYWRNY